MRKLPALGLALMVLPPSLLGQAESAVLNAASLVKDGGFEQRRFCPSDFNQQRLRTLDHWGQVSDGTPDHFASCSKEAGVPGNRFGTEPSLEGDAYGGLVVFSRAKWRYREYLSNIK